MGVLFPFHVSRRTVLGRESPAILLRTCTKFSGCRSSISPEENPSGAELERQGAFSGSDWLGTAVRAAVCVWLWVSCLSRSMVPPNRLLAASVMVHQHAKDVGLSVRLAGLEAWLDIWGAWQATAGCALPTPGHRAGHGHRPP